MLVVAILASCAIPPVRTTRPKSPERYRENLRYQVSLIRKDEALRDKVFAAHVSDEVGLGLFAKKHFNKADYLLDYAPRANRYHLSQSESIPREDYIEDQIVRVADEVYAAGGEADPSDLINHSCDANAYVHVDEKYPHRVKVYARRPIRPGEEIRIDYRLFASADDRFDYMRYGDTGSFVCRCNARECTGVVRFQSLPIEKQRALIGEGIVPFYILNDLKKSERGSKNLTPSPAPIGR